MRIGGLLLAVLGLPLPAATAAAERTPESVAGLVARYEVDGLRRLAHDAAVETWVDASGNGHDLVFGGVGLAARLRAQRLAGRPVVEVRKRGTYAVREPFELADHTIFLVLRSEWSDRALFADEGRPTHGVLLFDQSRSHLHRTGGVGTDGVAYAGGIERDGEFGITVLARESGRLRAFVDGVEVSSGDRDAEKLRVGTFFRLEYGPFVDRDGAGLELAELLFYERFLPREERESVTRFLARRWGLSDRLGSDAALADRLDELRDDPQAEIVWLGTDAGVDLNRFEDLPAVAWTRPRRVGGPFAHEAGEAATRIRCTRDATLARVHVALGLKAQAPGLDVRVLLLKNGTDYHDQDATSGVLDAGGEAVTVVRLDATLLLDAGDWIEVVGQGVGAAGEARLVPERTLFVASAR